MISSSSSSLTLIDGINTNTRLNQSHPTTQSGDKQAIRSYSVDGFIGHSPLIQRVRTLLIKLSQVPFSAVTISGETGTGKGLAVRILHYNGLRANGPLVEINCAALPRELLESELFGHEAGAFTGARHRHRGLIEQANGGTLFLDEIGEMSLDLQSKLLKAVEDKVIRHLGGETETPIDIQIIAASNRDLKNCVLQGLFRGDLYHRLTAFRLDLPSLRERKEDLEDLLPVLLHEFNTRANKQVFIIPTHIWQRLYDYDWPGNVRELRNVVERCVLLAEGEVFTDEWLQLDGSSTSKQISEIDTTSKESWIHLPLDGSMRLEEMDCYIIKAALEKNHHNILATARALGTTRETLRYRVQKYRLNTLL